MISYLFFKKGATVAMVTRGCKRDFPSFPFPTPLCIFFSNYIAFIYGLSLSAFYEWISVWPANLAPRSDRAQVTGHGWHILTCLHQANREGIS